MCLLRDITLRNWYHWCCFTLLLPFPLTSHTCKTGFEPVSPQHFNVQLFGINELIFKVFPFPNTDNCIRILVSYTVLYCSVSFTIIFYCSFAFFHLTYAVIFYIMAYPLILGLSKQTKLTGGKKIKISVPFFIHTTHLYL